MGGCDTAPGAVGRVDLAWTDLTQDRRTKPIQIETGGGLNCCCLTDYKSTDASGFEFFKWAWLALSLTYLIPGLVAVVRAARPGIFEDPRVFWLAFACSWLVNGILYFFYSAWID